MPQTSVKILTLDDFYNGQAEVDLDIRSNPGEFGYAQDFDILRHNDFLTQHLGLIDDSQGLGADREKMRGYAVAAGDGKIYAVNHYLSAPDYISSVYSKSSIAGNWGSVTSETTANTSTEPPFGLYDHQGYLYFFANDRVIARQVIPPGTLTDAWDTLNTTAWGGNAGTIGGALKHSDGNLYFYKANYMGVFDGVTLPSATTPIDIDSDYTIADAISKGHFILFAANAKNASQTSKLFLWDPYSSLGLYTFDEIYNTSTFNIQALREVGSDVIILTAVRDYQLIKWMGENQFEVKKTLPVNSITTFTIRKSAVDVKLNTMYFGTNNSVSGFNNAIYVYGKPKTSQEKILFADRVNPNNDLSNIDYRVVKWIQSGQEDNMHVNWYDGSTYYMSRIGSLVSANALLETIYFRPWRNRRSQCIEAKFFHAPLSSTDRFKFEMKRDLDSSFTEIDTTIGTTGSSETTLRNNQSGLTNNYLKGWKHKAKVSLTSGTTFRLEAIKFKFRTVEQK